MDTNELQRYAGLGGDELSEFNELLLSIYSYYPYFLTHNAFGLALEEEMQAQLDNFTENSKIVDCEETKSVTYQKLEWKT